MRRHLALAALAAAAYVLAAWSVAPGFFDGFAPAEAYRWVSPPAGVSNPGPPHPGTGQLTAQTNYAGSVFTADAQPQASMSVVPGAFRPPSDRGPVTVTIRPVSSFPDTAGLSCVTNVYLVTSTSPLTKDALVTLRFSDAVPAPSDLYLAAESGGGWEKLGNIGASAPFYISARTTKLGYFAGCYPAEAGKTARGVRVGGNQTLPAIVALAILLVVLGGLPLALLRRRRPDEEAGGGPDVDGPGGGPDSAG